MRLTVIGCSGSYPGPDSAASCYLLEAADGDREWRILLDLGNGALGELHRHIDPLTVDAVLLSHLHADHCLDLCGFHVMRRYHPRGAQPRIPVWGPVGTADRLARAYDMPSNPGMNGEFDFHEYDGRQIHLGPFTVTAVPVVHPVPAFALRVEAGGRTVTYSGDTGHCPRLVEAARDADLLLVEASFREGDDNPPALHLTGREAGDVGTLAGARRVVVTHVPPWHDAREALAEARTSYAGHLSLATRGATYEV
jgi:ribonuclease BN (tRNA processing enzyme)